MTWVEVLPTITAFLYVLAAIGYASQGLKGMSLAYAAYALANVGLIWAAVELRR